MNDRTKPLCFRFQGERGTRLDKFLVTQLTGTSRTKVREWIAAGHVRLNRKQCRISSKILLPGATIEFFPPNPDGSTPRAVLAKQLNPAFDLQKIIYEDKDLVVVDKPAGLPAQPTRDPLRANCYNALRLALAQRDRVAPDHYYLTLQHRLDRDTSGVMLFTKSKRLNKAVTDAFRNHEAKKIYLAIVEGVPEKAEGEYKNYLGLKPDRTGAYSVASKGGKLACTRWRMLDSKPWEKTMLGLVLVKPETGRTHQIRVQFSHVGLPLLGDSIYGAKVPGFRRTLLHALSLEIIGRTFTAQAPDDFLALFPNLKEALPQLLADE